MLYSTIRQKPPPSRHYATLLPSKMSLLPTMRNNEWKAFCKHGRIKIRPVCGLLFAHGQRDSACQFSPVTGKMMVEGCHFQQTRCHSFAIAWCFAFPREGPRHSDSNLAPASSSCEIISLKSKNLRRAARAKRILAKIKAPHRTAVLQNLSFKSQLLLIPATPTETILKCFQACQ